MPSTRTCAGMSAGIKKFVSVNLRQLSASGKFAAGEEVTLELLRQRNLLNLSGREATLPLKARRCPARASSGTLPGRANPRCHGVSQAAIPIMAGICVLCSSAHACMASGRCHEPGMQSVRQTMGRCLKWAAGLQILGDGELAMPLTIHATQFSASARAKIEAAGGSIVEVPAKV